MSVQDEDELLAKPILSDNLAAVLSAPAVLQLNCRNLLFLNIQKDAMRRPSVTSCISDAKML